MKKKFVIVIILLSSLGIQAQELFIPQATLGIKQGLAFSKVSFDPVVDQSIIIGYTGGLIFKYFAQKSLGIQIELNYSQQGWTEKLGSPNIYSRRINCVTLPFMTHVELGKGSTKYLLNVGPTVSYVISEKETIQLNETASTKTYYGSNTLNKSKFGICVGMGMVKKTSIGSFQAELRYSHNLSDIFTNNHELSLRSCKQQTLEVTISYLIEFKKSPKNTSKEPKKVL
jgi:hypothetical protein